MEFTAAFNNSSKDFKITPGAAFPEKMSDTNLFVAQNSCKKISPTSVVVCKGAVGKCWGIAMGCAAHDSAFPNLALPACALAALLSCEIPAWLPVEALRVQQNWQELRNPLKHHPIFSILFRLF